MTSRLIATLRPPRDQLALLEAIHCPAADLPAAFARWQAIVGDRPDDDSTALIPLLAPRLKAWPADALVAHCRTVYRLAWAKDALLRARREQALAPLRATGISPILIKGAALQAFHPEGRLRPYGDMDLVVAHPEMRPAIAVYLDAGWRSPKYAKPRRFDPRFAHAIELHSPAGDIVDLHGHPMHHWITWPRGAALFQRGAVPFAGAPGLRTLCPEHHLLHTVVNTLAAARPHGRWMADVAAIVALAAIDWTRLAGDAEALDIAPLIGVALAELGKLGVQAPPAIVARLTATAVSPRLLAFDRALYRGDAMARLRGHWGTLRAGAGTLAAMPGALPAYTRFCLARRGGAGRA